MNFSTPRKPCGLQYVLVTCCSHGNYVLYATWLLEIKKLDNHAIACVGVLQELARHLHTLWAWHSRTVSNQPELTHYKQLDHFLLVTYICRRTNDYGTSIFMTSLQVAAPLYNPPWDNPKIHSTRAGQQPPCRLHELMKINHFTNCRPIYGKLKF